MYRVLFILADDEKLPEPANEYSDILLEIKEKNQDHSIETTYDFMPDWGSENEVQDNDVEYPVPYVQSISNLGLVQIFIEPPLSSVNTTFVENL